MGRTVDLVYAFSESIEETVNEKYKDIIIDHDMLFWDIVDDELYPHGCNYKDTLLDFENQEFAESSKEHIDKFNGEFQDDFCFVSERAIDELASFLKMFDSYGLMFIIKDSQSCGLYNYMIRGVANKNNIDICLEIIYVAKVMKRTTVKFSYQKE